MTTYYCEIKGNESNPHFPGYKYNSADDATAIAWFKQYQGRKLELVYKEDDKGAMIILWEL